MVADVKLPSQQDALQHLQPEEVGGLIVTIDAEAERMHRGLKRVKSVTLRDASERAYAMAQAVHLASRIGSDVASVRKDLDFLVELLDVVLLLGGKARVTRETLVSAMCARMMARRLTDYLDYRLSQHARQQPLPA